MQIGKCSKTKNARPARKITSGGKTENISILILHVTTAKRAKRILSYKKVLVDDKKTTFHKNVCKSKISAGKCRSSCRNKLKSSFVGRKTFRMHVCNDRGVMWMCNVSHTYCFNRPSALVPSAVVIRRMIVKIVVCFSFK